MRTNIDIAIQGISGFLVYSPSGYIAPDGVLQSGYITFENMEAYNAALANVENATFYSAEDFITDNQQAAQDNMEQAVNDFVEATLAIVTVIEVAEQADNAAQTGDIADQEALQDFIQDNDVYLTEQEVADYNQAITDIEEYGNQFGWESVSVMVDLSQYYKSADEYYAAGQENDFYTTSPIACGYDFSRCNE